MYYKIFHFGNIILYILLGLVFLMLLQKIIYHIVGLFPTKRFKDAKKEHKYAILIPARNESKVIESLLISIKDQNYNQELLETYVIVESEDDPTCEIAKKYKNTKVFVRKHLELKGKGYALNEMVEEILKKRKKYDAFFIFDADNVLTPNFINEMNKCFDAGYEIAIGYRNSKNWNGGWVASCSALTFSMVNTFHNKCRSRLKRNIVLSGTGFYISGRILKELGGWKFHTLTEDYELSMFSTIHDIKSTYNEYAEFYDEQPTSLKTSWNQRLRWVKGYGQVNKKYRKELFTSMLFDKNNRQSKIEYAVSILPVLILLFTFFAYPIFTLVLGIIGSIWQDPLRLNVYIAFACSSVALYLFFVIYTMIMLIAERKHINITFKNALACCFMGPIFMGLYIPLFFTALFKKQVEWKPISHSVNLDQNEIKQTVN